MQDYIAVFITLELQGLKLFGIQEEATSDSLINPWLSQQLIEMERTLCSHTEKQNKKSFIFIVSCLPWRLKKS